MDNQSNLGLLDQEEAVRPKYAFTEKQQRVYDYCFDEKHKNESREEKAKALGITVAGLAYHVMAIKKVMSRAEKRLSKKFYSVTYKIEGDNSSKLHELTAAELKLYNILKDADGNKSLNALMKDARMKKSTFQSYIHCIRKKGIKIMSIGASKGGIKTPPNSVTKLQGIVLDAVRKLNGNLSMNSLVNETKLTKAALSVHMSRLKKAKHDVPMSMRPSDLEKWVTEHNGKPKTNKIESKSVSLTSSEIPGGRELTYDVNIMLNGGPILHLAGYSEIYVVGNNVKLDSK